MVNHHCLILGREKKGGSEFNVWTEFFSQQILIFFHNDIDDNDDYVKEFYDFQDELINFEQILRMSRDN